MVKLTEILMAGGGCPYQLEATTDDGQYFYLRYRNGWLRAGVALTELAFWSLKRDWSVENPYNVIDQQVGDSLDGVADHEKFMALLKDKVEFPADFSFNSFIDTYQPIDDRS